MHSNDVEVSSNDVEIISNTVERECRECPDFWGECPERWGWPVPSSLSETVDPESPPWRGRDRVGR
jgi:hypothetical protein